MKKKIADRIKKMADEIGPKIYTTNEWIDITGEDLLLSGHKMMDGKPIEKLKVYQMLFPVIHKESLESDLKKAWYKKGEKGLQEILANEYVARVKKGRIKP